MTLLGQAACLASGGEDAAPARAEGDHAGCELTVSSSTLAGACGQLSVHNTGTDPMTGWSLAFDLRGDTHLINAWNGTFAQSGTRVTVTAPADHAVLAAGEAVTVGFCASGSVGAVTVVAGACGSAVGTAAPVVTPATTAPAVAEPVAAAAEPAAGPATADGAPAAPTEGGNAATATPADGVLALTVRGDTL